MLSFVRSADKFMEEAEIANFDRQSVLVATLVSDCPSESDKLPKVVAYLSAALHKRGIDSDEYRKGISSFKRDYPTFREDYAVRIRLEVMRSMLRTLIPFTRAREDSRGIPAHSPLSLARSMELCINSDIDAIAELDNYRRLALIWQKAHECRVAGKNDEKYVAAAVALKESMISTYDAKPFKE